MNVKEIIEKNNKEMQEARQRMQSLLGEGSFVTGVERVTNDGDELPTGCVLSRELLHSYGPMARVTSMPMTSEGVGVVFNVDVSCQGLIKLVNEYVITRARFLREEAATLAILRSADAAIDAHLARSGGNSDLAHNNLIISELLSLVKELRRSRNIPAEDATMLLGKLVNLDSDLCKREHARFEREGRKLPADDQAQSDKPTDDSAGRPTEHNLFAAALGALIGKHLGAPDENKRFNNIKEFQAFMEARRAAQTKPQEIKPDAKPDACNDDCKTSAPDKVEPMQGSLIGNIKPNEGTTTAP